MVKSDPNKVGNSNNPRKQTKFDNQEIQALINKMETKLITDVINYQRISARELISYFENEAPSGDLTLLSDILDNQWLLIHELVELSELKTMKLEISAQLLKTHPVEVDHAHITATEYEFKFAKKGNDVSWINSRIKDVHSWIEDDTMTDALNSRCIRLIKEYSY